ncbi:unnamed protein product, partial [Iphiclides podalirius]
MIIASDKLVKENHARNDQTRVRGGPADFGVGCSALGPSGDETRAPAPRLIQRARIRHNSHPFPLPTRSYQWHDVLAPPRPIFVSSKTSNFSHVSIGLIFYANHDDCKLRAIHSSPARETPNVERKGTENVEETSSQSSCYTVSSSATVCARPPKWCEECRTGGGGSLARSGLCLGGGITEDAPRAWATEISTGPPVRRARVSARTPAVTRRVHAHTRAHTSRMAFRTKHPCTHPHRQTLVRKGYATPLQLIIRTRVAIAPKASSSKRRCVRCR